MGSHSFRSDNHLDKELNYIKQTLAVNQSQAIAESIHHLYKKLRNSEKTDNSLIDVFNELGLTSCIHTEADLSETYKEHLRESLKRKCSE